MLDKAQEGNAEIIEKVVALLRDEAPEGKIRAERFVRQYYSQVDPEDLAERSIPNLCGAALAHAILTDRKLIPAAAKKRLAPIIGKYIS